MLLAFLLVEVVNYISVYLTNFSGGGQKSALKIVTAFDFRKQIKRNKALGNSKTG